MTSSCRPYETIRIIIQNLFMTSYALNIKRIFYDNTYKYYHKKSVLYLEHKKS
jgi:hypothetical protein